MHVDVPVVVDHSPCLVRSAEVAHTTVAVVSADGVGETRVEIINLIHKAVLSVEWVPIIIIVIVNGLILCSCDLMVVIKPKNATFLQ